MNMPESIPDSASKSENVNVGVDTTMAALLGILDGSSGASDPITLLKTQLEAQSQTNPQSAMILQLLEKRQQQQLQRQHVIEEEAEQVFSEEANQEIDECTESVSGLQQMMDITYSELEVLRTRNDTLAAALGACYLCFGEDLLCEKCGGRGLPGSNPPEVDAFRKYVLPAVRKAQTIENNQRGCVTSTHVRKSGQPDKPNSVSN